MTEYFIELRKSPLNHNVSDYERTTDPALWLAKTGGTKGEIMEVRPTDYTKRMYSAQYGVFVMSVYEITASEKRIHYQRNSSGNNHLSQQLAAELQPALKEVLA